MHVSILKLNDAEIEIYIEGVKQPIVNAIRRYALAKVPAMAVDEVYIFDNTSPLDDEVLAHRLAMVPLTTEQALTKYSEVPLEICARCTADEAEERSPMEECQKCFAILMLEVENDGSGPIEVYSSSIRSADPDVKPVYDDIPIVVLAPNQRISMELRARLGYGYEHAKWSPATISVARFTPIVTVDRNKCTLCGKCVEVCPRKVIAVGSTGVEVKDLMSCTLCRQCEAACPVGAISVKEHPDRLILEVESGGALSPQNIVMIAAKILLSELQYIYNQVLTWSKHRHSGGEAA